MKHLHLSFAKVHEVIVTIAVMPGVVVYPIQHDAVFLLAVIIVVGIVLPPMTVNDAQRYAVNPVELISQERVV